MLIPWFGLQVRYILNRASWNERRTPIAQATHLHLLLRDKAAVVSCVIVPLQGLEGRGVRSSIPSMPALCVPFLGRGNSRDPERHSADLAAPLAVTQLVAHGACRHTLSSS